MIAAATALTARYAAPSILIGHSLGGAAALAAMSQLEEVVAVATVGAPFDPEHVAHLLGDAKEQIRTEGVAEVNIGGRPFSIRREFLDDLAQQPTESRLQKLRGSLMVFHSPQDSIVDIDNARKIYQAARHPKSFVSLDGADHLLRKRSDAEYVARVLSAWAERYLPNQSVDVQADGKVVVEGRASGFLNEVAARTHRIIADEPIKVGGTDRGLTPYELLLASLGACTSMTLRMYATRKKMSLESVRVTLFHSRVHADDCVDCEKNGGHVDVIEKEIELRGDLSQEDRSRLKEIAERCPVNRTLLNEIKIRSQLISEQANVIHD